MRACLCGIYGRVETSFNVIEAPSAKAIFRSNRKYPRSRKLQRNMPINRLFQIISKKYFHIRSVHRPTRGKKGFKKDYEITWNNFGGYLEKKNSLPRHVKYLARNSQSLWRQPTIASRLFVIRNNWDNTNYICFHGEKMIQVLRWFVFLDAEKLSY